MPCQSAYAYFYSSKRGEGSIFEYSAEFRDIGSLDKIKISK
jgi:hypothetical protein